MYEHLLNRYRVFFEGMPEPVFYGHLYPMGDKGGPHGQRLWDEFNYSRGLKKDKDTDGRYLREYGDAYERDLRDLLNSVIADYRGKNRGVIVIPSSARGETNRVTELVRRVLGGSQRSVADLTRSVTRSKSKAKSHAGGSRSYDESYDTIDIDRGAGIARFDVLVVIDDILTTGTSFRAMDDKIRDSGFGGTIVNYAFSHTFPSEGVTCCWEWELGGSKLRQAHGLKASQYEERPIEALVFDLDQTLLDDSHRDTEFEDWSKPYDETNEAPYPYAPYDGVRELMRLCVPFAIVSNRPPSQIQALLANTAAFDSIYPYYDSGSHDLPYGKASWQGPRYFSPMDEEAIDLGIVDCGIGVMPRNAFSFPAEDRDGYTVRYYKPSPRGVNNALGYLRGQFLGDRDDARVVGLGNTYEDMVAYNAAGIESALALWGVPDPLKAHARKCWGASHVFGTVGSFSEWISSNARYYERAVAAEEADPAEALGYYELAVRYGDNARESAFRLARMIQDDDPARASRLYEMAIAAGDECMSTNNLGVLVQRGNPERARGLFERAISAGNEKNATRNLARLIGRDDPTRAVRLLERAALAGNSDRLAQDLEPLIVDGVEEAVRLYERMVVARDGRLATNLANMVKDRDPKRARRLYEEAIASGEERYATYYLGVMLMSEHPERATRLFERAVAAGNERDATNALGYMLVGDDEERARALFLRAIGAGDKGFATVNLSRLVRESDPEWALRLLEEAAGAGRTDLSGDLMPLVQRNMPRAIDLYERVIVGKDGKLANNLAEEVKSFDPDRAKRLYWRAIDAGDERYATCNLGMLIMDEDPDCAKDLFRRAVAAGDERLATNGLGILEAKQCPRRAMELFERACAAGDMVSAPCNIAHLLVGSDPRRALALYEQSASFGETEAKIGLAYLLRDEDPKRSQELLSEARGAENRDESVRFTLGFMGYSDADTAHGVARFLLSNGFDVVAEAVLTSALGPTYDKRNGTALIGRSPDDGEAICWTVIEYSADSVLLLCNDAVVSMPYCVDATSARWKDSAIRAWLNSTFKDEWLAELDGTRLVRHGRTGDPVFCLDTEEVEALASKRQGILGCRDWKTRTRAGWWVRIDEGETMSAPCVTENNEVGWRLALLSMGVRPALRINLRFLSEAMDKTELPPNQYRS